MANDTAEHLRPARAGRPSGLRRRRRYPRRESARRIPVLRTSRRAELDAAMSTREPTRRPMRAESLAHIGNEGARQLRPAKRDAFRASPKAKVPAAGIRSADFPPCGKEQT